MNIDLAKKIAAREIRGFEQCATKLPDGRIKAYWDKYGKVWTIGWGNTYYQDGSAVREGDIITQAQADTLLDFVIDQKEKIIRPYFKVKLNENQYAALISLAYNCGEGNLKKSHLLELINAGASRAEIEDQFDETCVTAKGVWMKGLYNRRLSEMKLFYDSALSYVTNNPEISIATALTIFGLAGYYLYRAAKLK